MKAVVYIYNHDSKYSNDKVVRDFDYYLRGKKGVREGRYDITNFKIIDEKLDRNIPNWLYLEERHYSAKEFNWREQVVARVTEAKRYVKALIEVIVVFYNDEDYVEII